MMEQSLVRFYLIPALMVIHGFFGHAFGGIVFQSEKDSAIINDWYHDAFRSLNSNLRKSDDLINKAWKMSIDIAYDQGIADGYYYTGCVYEQKGALNVARRYFEKAVTLYSQGGFLDNLPDCYKRLGKIYITEGRYYTALQHFTSGLRVAEEQNNDVGQIELGIQLADYHNTISKDYKEAAAILQAAARQAKMANYPQALGTIYLQYGMNYASQCDYEQALHYTQLAKKEFGSVSNTENLLKALLVEGDIHGKLHDEKRLTATLEAAEPLLKPVDDQQLQIAYELLHATRLFLLGSYNAALDVCKPLYAQLDGDVQQRAWREVRSLYFKVLYALGDVRQADSLFNDYEYIKDSVYTAQYVGQGMEMRENYKLEEFERQIREQQLELSNTNYQRYGFIIGILVLLTVLVILYFLFREKDKLAHRVAIKNAEISVQNEILKQANRQNELLLREIHHRVKNNLQIINSLLNLQSRKTTNEEVLAMMQESSSRINSIALIHNKLYQQQSLNRLNIQDYIEQLGAHLLSIYNVGKKRVRFEVEANNVSLDIDTAIPIGLILTELMTNSLKYAFVDRDEGEISVHVKHEGEKDYELIFKDNGVGIPETKLAQPNETLGFRLIHSLTRQLAGIIQYTFGEFSMYNIRFKG